MLFSSYFRVKYKEEQCYMKKIQNIFLEMSKTDYRDMSNLPQFQSDDLVFTSCTYMVKKKYKGTFFFLWMPVY